MKTWTLKLLACILPFLLGGLSYAATGKVDTSKKAKPRIIQPSVNSADTLKKYQDRRYKSKVIRLDAKSAQGMGSVSGSRATTTPGESSISARIDLPREASIKSEKPAAWNEIMSREEFRKAYKQALELEMMKRAKITTVSRPSETKAVQETVNRYSKAKKSDGAESSN